MRARVGMKTHAAIALMIMAVFVGWLFYQTSTENQIRAKQLLLEERRFAAVEAAEQPPSEVRTQYTYSMICDPDGQAYLLNVVTGETWRWYRNMNKDAFEIEAEGWAPVLFSVGVYDYATPSAAQAYQEYVLESLRDITRQKFNSTLGQPDGTNASKNITPPAKDNATKPTPQP